MTTLRIFGMTAALGFLAAAAGGCALSEEFLGGAGAPAGSDSAAADGTGQDAATEEAATLADVAEAVVVGDVATEVAWSEGFSSISISPDYDPAAAYPPGYDPYNPGYWYEGNAGSDDDGAGGDDGSGASSGSDDSDDAGDSDHSGDSGGSGDHGCSGASACTWYGGWPGEFSGDIYCCETESLEGYGGFAQDMKFCDISMAFDDTGVPDWIPIPVFARDGMLQADVRLVGQSGVYSYWLYDIVVTVVSANCTPTTADVVLEIDVSWFGDHSSIEAWGTHTLHTNVAGDSLTYSSQTHYDGHFWADDLESDDPEDDWEADSTQDFDCSGTLWRP